MFLPDLRKLFPRIMISHGRFRLFILQRYLHNGLHVSNLRFFLVFVWIPGFEPEVAHWILVELLPELFAFVDACPGGRFISLFYKTQARGSSVWIIRHHNIQTLLFQDLWSFGGQFFVVFGDRVDSFDGTCRVQIIFKQHILLRLNQIQRTFKITNWAFLHHRIGALSLFGLTEAIIKAHLLLIIMDTW